jgi:hypothetical protein
MGIQGGIAVGNYVHVIYKAGTNEVAGKKVTWANRDLLSGEFKEADVLAVHIEHDQGGETNVLQFSGHDVYYLKYVGAAGLMIRVYSVTQPGLDYAKTWFLRINGNQDTPVEMPTALTHQAGAGMQVGLMAYDWKNQDYADLADLARDFDLTQSVLLE